MKKYINLNYFWASLFVEQITKMGVQHVCISPGSRNSSLTFAFASNKKNKKYIHIDERSSGFFALGIAKKTNRPVAIATTSGTAVAELYPAIIEAYQQRIPLIICTADRPSYLIDVGANQTINQDNIYKNHIRYYSDLGLPSISANKLKRLISKTTQGLCCAAKIDPGPVHFNLPFQKPFEPTTFTNNIDFKLSDFIIEPVCTKKERVTSELKLSKVSQKIRNSKKGIIILSWGNFDNKFYNNLVEFSKLNSFPIFVDGTSSSRFNKSNAHNIISNHTSFINYFAKDVDLVIQFGNAPTSQSMLNFMNNTQVSKILVNKYGDLKDPSRNKGTVITFDENKFLEFIERDITGNNSRKSWLEEVISIDNKCEIIKCRIINKSAFRNEPRLVNETLKSIPDGSNLFISNSMLVRDYDYFASKNSKSIKVFTNRGASGIDGIISTASGIASQSINNTFLVIGDLAFYHNISALSTLNELNIPLKIILVNNNGGGIFNMLAVSKNNKYFDKYWRTPQNINYSKIIKGFGGNYYSPNSWRNFNSVIQNSIENKSFSVIELKTDSDKSHALRNKYWDSIKRELSLII